MKGFRALEVFRCEPLSGARLSRGACGRRHARARAKGEKGIPGLVTGTCARCEVGAKHAKQVNADTWQNGAQVATVEVVPVVGQKRLLGPGKNAPRPLRRPKKETPAG